MMPLILQLENRKKAKENQLMRLKYRTDRLILRYEKLLTAHQLALQNVNDLNLAINALKDGELKRQLLVMLVKATYKLFIINQKLLKLNVSRIVINQSKLNELAAVVNSLHDTLEMLKENSRLVNNEPQLLYNNIHNDNNQAPVDGYEECMGPYPAILKIPVFEEWALLQAG